ncbi:hypothetical protein LEP1GSC168_1096 [Leptospira santarosai str. HAI134]|nr:hypothetical protein LEP1GSC168_1096 [Leptospira santarosai str. HAI134]
MVYADAFWSCLFSTLIILFSESSLLGEFTVFLRHSNTFFDLFIKPPKPGKIPAISASS